MRRRDDAHEPAKGGVRLLESQSQGGSAMTSSSETGQVTGTKDKDYNLIWFTEACLSNALRSRNTSRMPSTRATTTLPNSSARPRPIAAKVGSRARICCAPGSRASGVPDPDSADTHSTTRTTPRGDLLRPHSPGQPRFGASAGREAARRMDRRSALPRTPTSSPVPALRWSSPPKQARPDIWSTPPCCHRITWRHLHRPQAVAAVHL